MEVIKKHKEVLDLWIKMLRSKEYNQTTDEFLTVTDSDINIFDKYTEPKSSCYSYCCLGVLQIAYGSPLKSLVMISKGKIGGRASVVNTPIHYLKKIDLDDFFVDEYPKTKKAMQLAFSSDKLAKKGKLNHFFEVLNDYLDYSFLEIADIVEEIKDKILHNIPKVY